MRDGKCYVCEDPLEDSRLPRDVRFHCALCSGIIRTQLLFLRLREVGSTRTSRESFRLQHDASERTNGRNNWGRSSFWDLKSHEVVTRTNQHFECKVFPRLRAWKWESRRILGVTLLFGHEVRRWERQIDISNARCLWRTTTSSKGKKNIIETQFCLWTCCNIYYINILNINHIRNYLSRHLNDINVIVKILKSV